MRDLLFGALSGDMGALSVLFVFFVPVYFAVVLVSWLKDKVSGK